MSTSYDVFCFPRVSHVPAPSSPTPLSSYVCILRGYEQDVAAVGETADQPVDRAFIVTGEAKFLAELLIPVAIEIGTDPGRAAISVEILTARLEDEISGHQGQRQIIPQRYVRFCADQERIRIVERNPAVIIHRSEEHTSELQSLMRISYAVFCLKQKIPINT